MAQKKTHDKFVQDFNKLFGEEYEIKEQYINAIIPIKIMHKKCGYCFNRKPNNLLSKKKCICPKCYPNKGTTRTIPYVNDIYATNKELYNLLLNKEDGHKFKESSNKKTWFKCTFCGENIYKSIDSVNINGLSCPICGSGISYPEKFMSNLLSQLNIKFIYQFIPEWAHPYRYDFMFELKNKKYIVEMDGGLHKNPYSIDNRKLEEIIKTDKLKDDIAISHDFIVIRIDCDYKDIRKRYDYIKSKILNSELNNIFNLNKVDFDICNKISETSTLMYIVKLWNNNIRGYDNLYKETHLVRSTIRNNLKKASEIGLIKESYEEILKINRKFSNKKLSISKGQKVLCNETGEIFNTYGEANKKYNAELSNYFSKKQKTSGCLLDGTRLTWTKLEN